MVPPGLGSAVLGTARGGEGWGVVPPGRGAGRGQNIDIAKKDRRLSLVILRRSDSRRTTDHKIL